MSQRSFGAQSTTDEVLEGIDLSGQTAIVTGASGGLGAETARALASRGAAVTLTARDVQKGEAVAAEVREATGNPHLEVRPLELGNPASIRAFAKGWLGDHPQLQLLINNAGIMACPQGHTTQGFELQFGTNHLGHFLLTGLLAPALRAGAPARVVSVSSGGHRFSPVVFEDIHFEHRAYDKWSAYGQAKSANALFAVELDRRMRNQGVRAFAIHPGMILTELGRHMSPQDIEALQQRVQKAGGGERGGAQWKPIPAGAATQVYAATAPELEGQGGVYLEDCHLAAVSDDPEQMGGVMGWAQDPAAARQLWEVSEEAVGERFPLGA